MKNFCFYSIFFNPTNRYVTSGLLSFNPTGWKKTRRVFIRPESLQKMAEMKQQQMESVFAAHLTNNTIFATQKNPAQQLFKT